MIYQYVLALGEDNIDRVKGLKKISRDAAFLKYRNFSKVVGIFSTANLRTKDASAKNDFVHCSFLGGGFNCGEE